MDSCNIFSQHFTNLYSVLQHETGFGLRCYQRTACCGWQVEECSPFAKADACVTVDGDQLQRTCVNVTVGPNDFLWPEIPGITLTKDGCREITDEENAARPEGNKITRICTCSTDG